MNWKGFRRKRSLPSRCCPGIRWEGLRNPTTKTSVRIVVSGPKLEPEATRILNRSVKHSTTTFSGNWYRLHSVPHVQSLKHHNSRFRIRIVPTNLSCRVWAGWQESSFLQSFTTCGCWLYPVPLTTVQYIVACTRNFFNLCADGKNLWFHAKIFYLLGATWL
jgi:hypothetical protein